jgi:hypothetical protein
MNSIDLDKQNTPLEVNFGAGRNLDAFGRLPVSEQITQFDLKQLFDSQPLLVDSELIGSATSVHSTTLSQTTLSVNANNDAAIAQTIERFAYRSGKGQNFYMTFNGFDSETNVTKRVGYFSASTTTPFNSDLDGIVFESNGTTLSLSTYRLGTQTATSNRADWDDPLDGTGPSGITHDFNNNTIFYCQFEWLGVGSCQFFVIKSGRYIPIKIFDFTDSTGVYMSSPNQPLRWEARATGAAEGGFNYICAAVNSEGSLNQIGKVLSANSDDNDLQLSTSGTLYACIGVRLKTTHFDAEVDLIEFDYLAETNDRALWELRLNPTVTGTFNYSDIANSAVQISVGNQTAGEAPTVSGGTILASGYVEQNGGRRIQIDSAIKLGATIDGTPNEIVLCVKPLQAGLDAYVSYNWREPV